MVVRGLKGHRHPRLKFCSQFGKGTVSDNILMCCVPDTAYGSHPIRCIPEKLALAVEIDLTWSRGFVSVELGRLSNPLSCKTLLICLICISKVLIEAPLFLIAASNPGPAALYCPPDNLLYSVVPCIVCIRPEQRTLSHLLSLFIVIVELGLDSTSAAVLEDTPYSISLNTPYRRFDTSYPTGGYGVSGDQSEQNAI
ncbi:hypothetical protein Tco_1061789 [Tanacetum coccineum]